MSRPAAVTRPAAVPAAYVLQRNGHVRIDVVSGRLAERSRQWIDLFCHILMLLAFGYLTRKGAL